MKRYSLIALALMLGVATPILATTHYSYAFNKQYIVDVSRELLDRSPPWLKDAENPPLSARKAIRLATEMKDTLVKVNDDFTWKLEQACLMPDKDDRWYWLVEFAAQFRAGSSGVPNNLQLAVLMDGSVVAPEIKDHR